MARVDDCVSIAEQPNVIFTTFGDAMRVPGTRKAYYKPKQTVVMCAWCIRQWMRWLARQQPTREVVFFALALKP